MTPSLAPLSTTTLPQPRQLARTDDAAKTGSGEPTSGGTPHAPLSIGNAATLPARPRRRVQAISRWRRECSMCSTCHDRLKCGISGQHGRVKV